jgi:putative ABC transport system permease protein
VPLTLSLAAGALLDQPLRTALAALTIALGVALGVAVHLVNASALGEFALAARQLAGEADLVVRGPRAGFDEAWYPRLARLPEVAAANPAVELDAPLADQESTIKIIGLDALRAAQVQPALLPGRRDLINDLFDPDAVLLSPSAAAWLGLGEGDVLRIRVGTRIVALRVIGLLPEEAYRQRIAVMDIGAAQWRLAQLGRLQRIDLKLAPGTDSERFARELQALLPPGVQLLPPEAEGARRASLTRAYRTNLDMLALVALFTGAFLVYSSQVLALLRRRGQLALLRVLGVTRRRLLAQLSVEAIAIGTLGAALGIALGIALATQALRFVGADLGAGYFRAVEPRLALDASVLAAFFVLGVAFAVAGAAVPAWQAAHRAPARALRAGDEDAAPPGNAAWITGAAAIGCALGLLPLPAFDGLPVAGYAAVALILTGTVLLMPRLTPALLGALPTPRRAWAAIAMAGLRAAPRHAALSVAAIVVSFGLMVAMSIMVHSFRASLDGWLQRVLPADLYLRAAGGGETAFLDEAEQARIAAAPGIARVEFLRVQNLLLAPQRPPVTLIARDIDAASADRVLPLVGSTAPPAPGLPPVWVSEFVADVYGLQPGTVARLPLAGAVHDYAVAGVWRDYARQNGAVVIARADYVAATGDRLANDAALWLAPGAAAGAVAQAVRERLGGAEIEIATPREVRALSLRLFDRTFAISYVLVAIAVAVGLAGVGIAFGAQAVSRRREFGMLRHLGMRRRDIGALLACEGALTAALGVVFGLAAGGAIGLILVHVVNRQSFHWGMELHLPLPALAALAVLLVVCAALTAAWSGRAAMHGDAVRAVREDW